MLGSGMLRGRKRRAFWVVLGLVAVLLAVGAAIVRHYFGEFAIQAGARPDSLATMARWPWANAKRDSPHDGVTRWIDRSSPDGTVLELLEFDFRRNPHLRLELYDQDEDDQAPFDNRTQFRARAVGQVTRHLNRNGRGRVVAAWNGLFFQHKGDVAGHVAPVVLRGKPCYNVGVVRWAVGVKYRPDGPEFRVMRLPEFGDLAGQYDYAAEGASCLIHYGRPMRLRPFPGKGEDPFPPSSKPGPGEAGFVRKVDHIRTSRTSMAWSKDNRRFYVLIIKEADAEAPSIAAFRHGLPLMGGWTVADLQRFWRSLGAWCAVNLDGGDVTQMTVLRRDGRYDLVPARWGCGKMRMVLPADLAGSPPGGSIMYFFIRDTSLAGSSAM